MAIANGFLTLDIGTGRIAFRLLRADRLFASANEEVGNKAAVPAKAAFFINPLLSIYFYTSC
jgi:hypothetical protein